jgi:nucleoid DNA-binding protein
MTKVELIEEISRDVEMTQKDSGVIVEAILDSLVRALRGGDKIEIRGFGTFRTRQRKSRVGRNPKTGVIPPLSYWPRSKRISPLIVISPLDKAAPHLCKMMPSP